MRKSAILILSVFFLMCIAAVADQQGLYPSGPSGTVPVSTGNNTINWQSPGQVLGVVSAGTWNGDVIDTGHGGTGTTTGLPANLSLPVSVANGGTGSATASGARTNLSAAASGANADITSLFGGNLAYSGGLVLEYGAMYINNLHVGGANQLYIDANGAIVQTNSNTAATPETITGASGQTADLLDINTFGASTGNCFHITSAGLPVCPSGLSIHGGFVDSSEFYSTGNAPMGDTSNTWGSLFFGANSGPQFKTGANGRIGSGTLVNGTVTISNTSITANSHIFLTRTGNASSVLGVLTVFSQSVGTNFIVKSLTAVDGVAVDTSTFDYRIEEWN